MKRAIAVLLCLTALATQADTVLENQVKATAGVVIGGTVSGSTIVSTAAAMELQGPNDVGLSLSRSGAANTTDEHFIAYWAKDANGGWRKSMSLSSKWGDPDAQNGYTVVRYNAAHIVGGVGRDDLSIRQFGGRGITLFGNGDTDSPPPGVKLMVNGNTWLKAEVQLERPLGLADGVGEPDCITGIAQLYVSTDHKLKIKMGNCTVYTLTP